MTVDAAVKQRILELCRDKRITINHLGYLSGITQSTIYNIVSGRNSSPTMATLKKLCDGLDISLPEFFASPLFHDLEGRAK